MKKRVLFVVFLLLFTFAATGKEIIFAQKGKISPVIVLPGKTPSEQQKIAAGELMEFLEKVVSVKAVTRNTLDAKAPFQILLADLTLPEKEYKIPSEIKAKLLKDPSNDSFCLRVQGKTLFIIGKSPRALVYGACFVIDKYLGVTFLYPGKQGESYHKKTFVKLPAKLDEKHSPFTFWRIAAYTIHDKKDVPWTRADMIKWQYRNLLYPLAVGSQRKTYSSIAHRDHTGMGHLTLCSAIPGSMYETHPEYFPLINGKRVPCGGMALKKDRSGKKLPWVHKCVSNLEVKKLVINHILSKVKKDPGAAFGISVADVQRAWCTCPNCKKYGTMNGKFSTSHLFHRFFKEVTDVILKEVPNANLWVYIYLDYRDVPNDPNFKYDKRVSAIYYAHGRCIAHPINSKKCSINPPYYKKYREWSKVFSRVGLCDYYGNANTPYAPHEYNFAADMPERVRRNDWGEREHITAKRFFHNALFYLVKARLWWDPDTDVEKFIEKVFHRYYGKCAVPMLKFQKMKKSLWENAPGHSWYPGPNRGAYCLALPENEKAMRALLDQAEKLAQNDPLLLARIKMEKAAFQTYWVAPAQKIRENLAANKVIPTLPANEKMIVDGVLDESQWKKVGVVNHFISPYTKNTLMENTNLRVLYDKKHFYISVECMNDKAWSSLIAKETRNDVGSLCDDDSVEIFLCHPENGEYYQFIINTLGKMYDAKMMDKSFNTGSKVAAKVYKDRYIVELAVPVEMTGIKEITSSQRWKIHVWRNIRNLQPPANIDRGGIDGYRPHSPQHYRPLIIGGKEVIKNGNFNMTKGKNGISAWRVSTPRNFAMLKKDNKNIVRLKSCKIYQRLNLSDTGHFSSKIKNPPCRIQITVSASGTGVLELIPSTGIPGSKTKPFHRQRKKMTSPLTKEVKDHIFTFDLEKGEEAYLFIGARNALIHWVSAIKIPSAGKK